MTDYPNCTCGHNNWQGGGGQIGPGYQFSGRKCGSCGNLAQYVGRDGWWCVLIFPQILGEAPLDYINTTMMLQARAYQALHEAVNDAKSKILFDDLLSQWDLDPAKGCVHHYLDGEYTPEGQTHTRSNFEYRDTVGNRLDIDHLAFQEACRKLDEDNPPRPDVLRAPDPINLPEGITAYVSRAHQWDLAKPFVGKLPKDPRRVRHDRDFLEVFQAVQEATGQAFAPTERKNGYYEDRTNSEPWYEFQIGGTTFTVGPRKRVTHISFKAALPVDYSALQALATTDKVTFEAKRPWEEAAQAEVQKLDQEADDWIARIQAVCDKAKAEFQGDPNKSTDVYIHAWGKDKAIEYLTRAILTVTPGTNGG